MTMNFIELFQVQETMKELDLLLKSIDQNQDLIHLSVLSELRENIDIEIYGYDFNQFFGYSTRSFLISYKGDYKFDIIETEYNTGEYRAVLESKKLNILPLYFYNEKHLLNFIKNTINQIF